MGRDPSAEPLAVRLRLLDESDAELLASFECGDEDLKQFLVDDAVRLQSQNVIRTYLAVDGAGGVAGYVALMTDAVVLVGDEKKKLRLYSNDHPVVPALKVARIAVAASCQRQGLGHHLMRFATSIALELAEQVGCRLFPGRGARSRRARREASGLRCARS